MTTVMQYKLQVSVEIVGKHSWKATIQDEEGWVLGSGIGSDPQEALLRAAKQWAGQA